MAVIQVEYFLFALDIEGKTVGLLMDFEETRVKIIANYAQELPDDLEDGGFQQYVAKYSKEGLPGTLELGDSLTLPGGCPSC
jgi:hypothetical protein